MEKDEEKKEPGVELVLDFQGATQGKPLFHTNQMTIQVHDNEVYLSFFEIIPPILINVSEEQLARIKEDNKIRPECVARLVMSPQFLARLHRVITKHLNTLNIIEDTKNAEGTADTGTNSPNARE